MLISSGLEHKFLKTPGIPGGEVSLCVAGGNTPDSAVIALLQFGVKTIRIDGINPVYTPVCCHADIVIHHIGGNRIVHAPGMSERNRILFWQSGFELIEGSTELESTYPGTTAYNVARIGGYAFHNLKYTDPVLLQMLKREGVEPVQVNQGYAGCMIFSVDENTIITSDPGIAKATVKKNIETLLIPPDKGIWLDNARHGFIGGATGLIRPSCAVICGDKEKHADYWVLNEFLGKKGLELISLTNDLITDVGSFIPLMEKHCI